MQDRIPQIPAFSSEWATPSLCDLRQGPKILLALASSSVKEKQQYSFYCFYSESGGKCR